MPAFYEVRITPLLLGVPGFLEPEFGGVTTIDSEEDTILVEQFLWEGFEVNIAINEPLTARVVIPIDEPVAADLEPFAQAVRVAYMRPDGTVPEALIYGPCNVITDYAAGTVTLEIYDPSIRCLHHYVRRGDLALNLDDDKGALEASAASIDTIIDAARNTQEQQDRDVPALAMWTYIAGEGVDGAALAEFERGQEVWDLCGQIMRSATGPDVYISPYPAYEYPFAAYAEMGLFDPMTNPASPVTGELGRNLDPADPDAPIAGEVIFDFGIGIDNLEALTVSPGIAVTHCHVLDADRKYRESAAHAAASAEVGVWVRWIATDTKVVAGDTAALRALANATVDGYGYPPKHFTCTLRPDDAQPFHYGHDGEAFFAAGTPGDFHIGDFVRVRAQRGSRAFSTLARITAAKFTMTSGGLPLVSLDMVPAIPGAADDDPQETP